MGRVVLDVSMSLDGYTTGPNVREAEPMGDGGERLHAWRFGNGAGSEIDAGHRTVDASVGAAVRRAKQAAGDKDVLVLGADVARQLLGAGLLDELRIHLVPLLLGAGTPLFDGEQAELIAEGTPVTGTVTHLRYRVATAPDRVPVAGS